MKFFLQYSCLLLLIQSSILSLSLKHKAPKEKANYPEVHVHMDPSTFDLKDLQAKSEDKRAQRNMLRDLEEKISLDKQAFQQISSIQNDEIQQLSEGIKMNSYYTMRKIINSKENKEDSDGKIKENNKEMSFEKKMELISNPFVVVKDENMKETMKNNAKNRLETYGDIVDKIYGG